MKIMPETASFIYFSDLSDYTSSLNHIFVNHKPRIEPVLKELGFYREDMIQYLRQNKGYPANRMGDGFISFFYSNPETQVEKRVLDFTEFLHQSFQKLQKNICSLIGEENSKLFPAIKNAALILPNHNKENCLCYSAKTEIQGNNTYDPKDFFSPAINFLARCLCLSEASSQFSLTVHGCSFFDLKKIPGYYPEKENYDFTDKFPKGFTPDNVKTLFGPLHYYRIKQVKAKPVNAS